jgi:hypothetical protein
MKKTLTDNIIEQFSTFELEIGHQTDGTVSHFSWQNDKIDFHNMKSALVKSQETIRNHIYLMKKNHYFYWLFSRPKQLKELEEGLYNYDKIMFFFLDSISSKTKNLNSLIAVGVEIQLLMDSHKIITDAANAIIQEIDEKHMKSTVFIALVTLVLSIGAYWFSSLDVNKQIKELTNISKTITVQNSQFQYARLIEIKKEIESNKMLMPKTKNDDPENFKKGIGTQILPYSINAYSNKQLPYCLIESQDDADIFSFSYQTWNYLNQLIELTQKISLENAPREGKIELISSFNSEMLRKVYILLPVVDKALKRIDKKIKKLNLDLK